MVEANSRIRWAMGGWCLVALVLVGWCVAAGVRPAATALLFVACAVPLGVFAALTTFRAQPQTVAQALHDDRPDTRS